MDFSEFHDFQKMAIFRDFGGIAACSKIIRIHNQKCTVKMGYAKRCCSFSNLLQEICRNHIKHISVHKNKKYIKKLISSKRWVSMTIDDN